MIEQLGNELRRRRAEIGMSREDVYKKFRIPLGFIAAIEQGNPERLPPLIYARGFLKSYCESLGLEPEPRLDMLDEGLRKPNGGFMRRHGMGMAGLPRPQWADDALMWVAIVGVVVFGWLAYSLLLQPGAAADTRHVQAETVGLGLADPLVKR